MPAAPPALGDAGTINLGCAGLALCSSGAWPKALPNAAAHASLCTRAPARDDLHATFNC